MARVDTSSPVRGPLGQKKPSAPSPREKEATAVNTAYDRLFNTRDGKLVLKDLRERFYDCDISDSDISRDVGKRDVLLFINKRVTP